MTISITIKDTDAALIADGFCAATGWEAANAKTPITKQQWIKERFILWLKAVTTQGYVMGQQRDFKIQLDSIIIT